MVITTTMLSRVSGVRHGFFTRKGGVSTGIYESLNCGFGSNDSPEAVATNRARVAERIGAAPQNLLTVFQVHSPDAVCVTAPWKTGSKGTNESPRADAMVTDRPGIALAVLTADCAPVLIADTKRRIIGAAHAGWKGALGGILEATITAMRTLGSDPADLVAAIGPCIGPRSYEVGPEFQARFLDASPDNASFFQPGDHEDRSMFDLAGYAAHRLDQSGVARIERHGADTAEEEERFFSYRRATLRGESDYGRGISVIALAI